MADSVEPKHRNVERVLVVAEDAERLRILADYLWAAECIAYCARSGIEAVALIVAGLRPEYVLVDPALGPTFVAELRAQITAAVPGLTIEVASMPIPTR